MKKILFITTTPFYTEKGSSLRVYSILKMLSEKYNIDLVTYSMGENMDISNVNFHRTFLFYKPKIMVSKVSFAKLFLDFLVFLKCLNLLVKNKYDIIHCEDFEAAFMGMILATIFRKRLVYDLHNRIIDNWSISGKKPPQIVVYLEKKIINRADLIIANWEIYRKDPIFKDKNIFLQYDSVSLDIQEIKVSCKKYLFYAGNFEKYQGVIDFIKFYALSKCKLPLIIAGKPTDELVELIKTEDLIKKVFLLGKKTVQETNYLIKNSEFCILPRVNGRQPSMKLIHYFTWSRPIIASNIECNQELLKDNYNGLTYINHIELIQILNSLDEKTFDFHKGLSETKSKIQNLINKERFLINYDE